MLGNVTWHVRECTSGVIGQCSGYKQKCGRFFCADHSTDYGDLLCSVCAEKLERDALAEYRFRDYLKTAEEIGVKEPPDPNDFETYSWIRFKTTFVHIIALCVIFIGICAVISVTIFPILVDILGEVEMARFVSIILVIPITLFVVRRDFKNGSPPERAISDAREESEAFKAKLASAKATKPGFAEFYEQWRKMKEQQQAEESAEAWRNALIGVIAVAAVAGAVHEQIKNDQMRRDVHDIARSIRRR